MPQATPSEVFETAIQKLPYPDAYRTGYEQGELDDQPITDDFEYSEEYVFTVGNLLDEAIEAGGWIDLRYNDGEPMVSGLFALARNGDWEKGKILGEYEALLGYYDTDTQTWSFEIGTY